MNFHIILKPFSVHGLLLITIYKKEGKEKVPPKMLFLETGKSSLTKLCTEKQYT